MRENEVGAIIKMTRVANLCKLTVDELLVGLRGPRSQGSGLFLSLNQPNQLNPDHKTAEDPASSELRTRFQFHGPKMTTKPNIKALRERSSLPP